MNSDSNGDEGREHTNENARDVVTLSKRGHAKLRDLLRFFRLQFIETILNKVTVSSWRAGTENRKYAMRRNRKLVENVVPFGALSGAIQATQLSYLWSLDYFSVWQFKSFRGRRKAIFVVALPMLIGLTALVGPSSAVLMIPRSGSPYTALDVTKYANISAETLFSSRDLPVDMFPM